MQFYFEVSDPEINLGSAYVSWKDPGTQLTIFAIDPSGNIAVIYCRSWGVRGA